MAGAAKIDDEDGINEINVTPLVDVMLVLLIIFMVASVYIVKESIELELPKAATATDTPETTVSIVMDKERAAHRIAAEFQCKVAKCLESTLASEELLERTRYAPRAAARRAP